MDIMTYHLNLVTNRFIKQVVMSDEMEYESDVIPVSSRLKTNSGESRRGETHIWTKSKGPLSPDIWRMYIVYACIQYA